ncbi:tryptophan-rich sensory protein [Candidatus Poribacteria bacterium]|nr:tryptophan-rich sensory protein [Candidatus Poribacteria bacterium]
MEKSNIIAFFKLVISIVICQIAGLLGSFFTTSAIPTWYATLKKPSFTPPNWLFAPVWTTLFVLMGVSAFLVWRKGLHDKPVIIALSSFGVQLVLNILWSAMFFGLKSPLAGFIDISILWLAILFTLFNFFKISTTAGILLIPYIAWVSFAAMLNLSLVILNP